MRAYDTYKLVREGNSERAALAAGAPADLDGAAGWRSCLHSCLSVSVGGPG